MVLSYIVVWMMVARLSLAVFRPARPLLLWGVLLAAQQAAELVVIGKTLRAGELLGAILGILLARVLFAGGATAVRDRLLLPLFAAYVVHVGLEPYAFASVAKPFGWLPSKASSAARCSPQCRPPARSSSATAVSSGCCIAPASASASPAC